MINFTSTPDNSDTNDNNEIEYKEIATLANISSHGVDACPLFDDIVNFIRKWAPRSYPGYHEAAALWILSAIAGGRIVYHFGKKNRTNLYLVIVGRSGIHNKSTVGRIAKQILIESGHENRLLPESCTPQKLISEMALSPEQYKDFLSMDQKEEI